MDLDRLAKELHGEIKEERGFENDSSIDKYTTSN